MLAIDMDADGAFCPDYRSARAKFRGLAEHCGADVQTFANPNSGPDSEALYTDLAWLGPRDAETVLVLVSATHGVEGFCGAGAQIDFLSMGGAESLPAGTAALLVHALNPFGFAWLRRVTEEGVDLNRNGIDFSVPPPANEAYAELADAFVPTRLDERALAEADARITDFAARHGEDALALGRSAGQYTHPEGIYYGGNGKTWCRRTIEQICGTYALADRKQVAVVDYHTGLGPYGYGEPICGHRPGEPGQLRCRAWYGESLGEPLLGTSASIPIPGLSQYVWSTKIGLDRLTFIALEFGTFASEIGHRALQADHWLHAYGNIAWDAPQTQSIKQALRTFYYPDTPDWRQSVLLRSRQVIEQALRGLESGLYFNDGGGLR